VKMRRQTAAGLDTFQLLQEIDVKVRPPEFAIGDALETDVFLQTDDIGDRRVFDGAERRFADLSLLATLARGQELRRPQEAADVIGAERRLRALAHGKVTRPDP
jgi:hypothetical protein